MRSATVTVVDPLAHPRPVVGEEPMAVALLQGLVRELLPIRLLSPAPRVVMHLLGEHAGGLAQVEIAALQRIARAAGAAEVVVWQGRDLTDVELTGARLPEGLAATMPR